MLVGLDGADSGTLVLVWLSLSVHHGCAILPSSVAILPEVSLFLAVATFDVQVGTVAAGSVDAVGPIGSGRSVGGVNTI